MKEIGRNAFVDWLVILFLSLFVGVVLIAGSAYLYVAVTKGNIKYVTTSEDGAREVFSNKNFRDIIETYKKKDERSEQARRGFSGIADPSQ